MSTRKDKYSELDLFQRTCMKKRVLEYVPEEEEGEEEEIEIFKSTSGDVSFEEEQEVSLSEEPIDIIGIQAELECMQLRIQKLQHVLNVKAKVRRHEVEKEILLVCVENNEICDLQKSNHKMQCKINEMVRLINCARDTIKQLRKALCVKAKEVHDLQTNIAQLQYWRKNLHHDFGVCIERFEYIKHTKAEFEEVKNLFDMQMNRVSEMERFFVPQDQFVKEKQEFCLEINSLKKLFADFQKGQMMRFGLLEQMFRKKNTTYVEEYGNTDDESLGLVQCSEESTPRSPPEHMNKR